MKSKSSNLTPEELQVIYRTLKDCEGNVPEEDYHNDYYNEYEEPVDKKQVSSIIKKIGKLLLKEDKEKIDKEFLRKKYHPYNNQIDEKVYSILEKAFEELKTVEIEYFNMDSAEFKKRKLDIYYKSRKYTIGYCHLRKAIRKFRTSRIASAKITSNTYKIPNGFDKNKY